MLKTPGKFDGDGWGWGFGGPKVLGWHKVNEKSTKRVVVRPKWVCVCAKIDRG